MKIYKKITLCLYVFVVSFNVFATAKPVKIAIIGKPGEYKTEIDLLTEKLSRNENIHMLERVDIDYIIKEHAIAASDIARSGIRIGELVGADGVIIFSDVEVKGKKYAYLRLVGVKSGLVLGTYEYQRGVKSEKMDWLTGAERKFARLFPKLTVAEEDIIPVSMLNFRSSSPSTKMINLERVIPKLLTIGLSIDDKIVVTERWDTWQVAFEKELANDLNDFKTGNVLIDGEFEEKQGNRGQKTEVRKSDMGEERRTSNIEHPTSNGKIIEISVRINKPNEDKKEIIKVSGKRGE